MLKRKLSLGARVILALAALAIVGVQTAIVRELFEPTMLVDFGIAVGLAIVVFADNVRAAWRTYSGPESAEKLKNIDRSARAAIIGICDGSPATIRNLGISVFAVQSRWNFGTKGIPWRRPELVRLSRFRMADHPQPSSVRWIEGKGAIGLCLKTRRQEHVDLRNRLILASQLSSEEEFTALPAEQAAGFTYSEFREVSEKYLEVLATPIKDATGKVVGVISIDRPAEDGVSDELALDRRSAREYAAHAAEWMLPYI